MPNFLKIFNYKFQVMKVCVISEELSKPFDEGIKNFAYNLIRELSKDNDALCLSIEFENTYERYIKMLGVKNKDIL